MSLVSALVASDLRCPVARVRLERRMMFRASMPKAAIDKNRDPRVSKDQVSGPPEIS